MKLFSTRKLLLSCLLAMVIIALAAAGALACTTIYVGGNLTKEGAPIVARSEDYVNSFNKLFYISPAGEYKEGYTYVGCDAYGGFRYTLSHDSYRFTAFTADVIHDGVCPECGLPGHPSYTESGANEKGVIVSATETISGNSIIRVADPFCRGQEAVGGKVGIEETDIPTVILSEAASAHEGVELLLSLYDATGCYGGSGLFIGDQKEIWYIENCSGSQYIAVKLNDDMVFVEPNTPVIGRIDLDDTENVIASKNLIATAKAAGCFVGDEAANVIDYRASYGNLSGVGSKNRTTNGLNFLNASYNYDDSILMADNTKFTISNLNSQGAIVKMYTNIKPDRVLTVDDVVNFYKLPGVAGTGNTDTAFFQLYADQPKATGVVEWVSMNYGAYNVFIPYYPLLIDQTEASYRAAVGEATKGLAAAPSEGFYYATVNSRTGATTYVAFPDQWETSMYWCYDALSNYILSAATMGVTLTQTQLDYVLERFDDLQEQIYADFAKLDVSNYSTAREAATRSGMAMAKQAHALALEMIEYLTGMKQFAIYNGDQLLEVQHYQPGALVTVNATPAAKNQFEFIGWDVKPTANQVVYRNGDVLSLVANTTLYAVWQRTDFSPAAGEDKVVTTSYTLTFNTNGGQAISPVTKADGTTVALSDYATSRQGYTFAGWFADADLKVSVTAVKLTANTTVYAKWLEGQATFQDVPANAYYAAAVTWAVNKGVTKGATAVAFDPNGQCTRAQAVTFLYRLAGSPQAAVASFQDVPADAYYAAAVGWAAAKGITTGTDANHFSPDQVCTRAEIVTFLYRYAGSPSAAAASFQDVAADAFYAASVGWAAAKGITTGSDANHFSPAQACTRAEIVTFLYRYIGE